MTALDYVAAALALCVVIILHEGGHYLTAVWKGMKVDRFSVFGIGPAIVKLGTWRGTEFVISAIPFGAYVLIRGMEAEEENEAGKPVAKDSSNFRDKPLAHRALVIAGGPIANYITAIVMFLMVFTVFGIKQPPSAIYIEGFQEDSAAEQAGMQVGDEFVRVGQVDIDPSLRGGDLSQGAEPHRGGPMPVVVLRDGALLEVSVQVPEDGLPLGVLTGARAERASVGIGTAVTTAVTQPFITSAQQLKGLWMLATGQLKGSVSGPVGIVEQFARAAKSGMPDFIEMTALISTLLGLFNLLPLPALDGGRLTFLGYEALMRRRANPRVEEAVHGYGMLALLALLAIVTFGDISRLL